MDRRAWWAAIHWVAQSRTRLKQLSGPAEWRKPEQKEVKREVQDEICECLCPTGMLVYRKQKVSSVNKGFELM